MPQAATLQDAIDLIIASIRDRRLVLFCGAGISFNSGLPLAKQLIEAILLRIDVSDVSHQLLMPPQLPFEAFVETLRGESNVAPLLELFKLGRPNTNHMLLAKLARRLLLPTVCTTNFDALIETALEAEGLQPGRGYNVAFREAELDAIPWSDSRIARVIKLHGSVADPEGMAITLRQVSHHELSAHRQTVIENLFSTGDHSEVLVLGYSCSDVFDISPHIESLPRKAKRILFVDHVPGGGSEVTELSQRSDRHPFRDFAGSLNIRCNTDVLMEAIWRGFLEEPYHLEKSTVGRASWEAYVDEWHAGVVKIPASQFNIAGFLLSRVSAWSDAARYFRRAVDTAQAAGDRRNQAAYLSSLGTAYTHLTDYQQAIACHRQGLELARQAGSGLSEATNAQNLANAYQAIGDLPSAYRYHKHAADIAVGLNNKEGMAATFAALGILLSRLNRNEEAIDYLQRAFSVAKDDANLSEQVKTLGSLGDAYLRMQRLDQAEMHYRQSIDLARKIGLKEAEGKTLGNLGIMYAMLNQFEQATSCLEQSRAAAIALADASGEGKVLGALGLCAIKQGDYQRSIELDLEALRIGHAIGDIEMRVTACSQLYAAHALLGNTGSAARFLAEARSIAFGHPHLVSQIEETVREIAPYVPSPPQRPGQWRRLWGWLSRTTR